MNEAFHQQMSREQIWKSQGRYEAAHLHFLTFRPYISSSANSVCIRPMWVSISGTVKAWVLISKIWDICFTRSILGTLASDSYWAMRTSVGFSFESQLFSELFLCHAYAVAKIFDTLSDCHFCLPPYSGHSCCHKLIVKKIKTILFRFSIAWAILDSKKNINKKI